MSEPKTRQNDASVEAFIEAVDNPQKRADSHALVELMHAATGEPARMWGGSIIGFGSYHYVYASGREGDWPLVGFSPRKQAISLYIMSGFEGHDDLMQQLGRHSTGKSCLYVKHLDDINLDVLRELIRRSIDYLKTRHGE